MRSSLFVALLSTASFLGCSSKPSSMATPPDAGPAIRCNGLGAPVALTATTVEAFLCWTATAGRDQLPNMAAAIDKAKGDEATLEALMKEIDYLWTRDLAVATTAEGIAKQLADPNAADRMNDFAWRDIPTGPSGEGGLSPSDAVQILEASAATAIVCVDTPHARDLVAKIIASHPSSLVRNEAQRTQTASPMPCYFYQ